MLIIFLVYCLITKELYLILIQSSPGQKPTAEKKITLMSLDPVVRLQPKNCPCDKKQCIEYQTGSVIEAPSLIAFLKLLEYLKSPSIKSKRIQKFLIGAVKLLYFITVAKKILSDFERNSSQAVRKN